MKTTDYVIVTSISAPNEVLISLATGCQERGNQFIVIGDEASPNNFHIGGCRFYNMKSQLDTSFKFSKLCPTKHYARKNIGYLLAIKENASVIVETDDDNFPYESFWKTREQLTRAPTLKDAGWVNVYRYFSNDLIWPRGLPLDYLNVIPPDLKLQKVEVVNCPIQQGLADNNPDVDAIFRLVFPKKAITFHSQIDIVLSEGTWCPFNSQNTTWFPEAYPLLYLPSYCSFRMTDIWRSFVAQRIAWTNNWGILFHGATVKQERNFHNLMKDFKDEIPGYIHNQKICDELSEIPLRSGPEHINENLYLCYEKLVSLGLIDSKELKLVNAWLDDLLS
jgi:hypothetical protein